MPDADAVVDDAPLSGKWLELRLDALAEGSEAQAVLEIDLLGRAPAFVGLKQCSSLDACVVGDEAAVANEPRERVGLVLVRLRRGRDRGWRLQSAGLPLTAARDGPRQDPWSLLGQGLGEMGIDGEGAREWQRMNQGRFLVALDAADILVGCVWIGSLKDQGYINLIAVEPLRQGEGFGSALLTASEARCQDAGRSVAYLTIASPRTELFPFYQRRGYGEVGRQTICNGPHELVLMSKAL